jgi:low affinity Fe/Cu permease
MLEAQKKMIGYEQYEASLVHSSLVFVIFWVVIVLWCV